jgi:hypothetical protein
MAMGLSVLFDLFILLRECFELKEKRYDDVMDRRASRYPTGLPPNYEK